MTHSQTNKGMGVPMIIIVLGLVLFGGIGYAVMKDPMGEKIEEETGVIMGKDAMMMDEKVPGGQTGETMMEKPTDDVMRKKDLPVQSGEVMMEKKDEAMMAYTGTMLGGTKGAPLLAYTKADYDIAVKSGKLVVLYFYANWCPLCKAEFPKMIEAFDGGFPDGKVIGFRVDYKDDQTDADEKALASEFGVAYQHTKVFVKNGAKVLKAPDTWDTPRYLSEINKSI